MKLIGTDGKNYYNWDLTPGKYILGRSPDTDFFVKNNTVSRNHAEIEITNDLRCFVRDLDSHNGTYVNSQKLLEAIEITSESKILFGETEFRISESNDTTNAFASRPVTTRLIAVEPEKSVMLSIDEALMPLSAKVTERQDVLPTIFEMAKRLSLDEPREVMLEKSLNLIARVIPAERFAILTTIDSDDDELYITASHLPEGKDPGNLTLSKTIINDILTNKTAILIDNSVDSSKFANQESIIMSKLQSAMAVPLFDEGKVLGILYVDTTTPLHKYDDDSLKLLATFGNIIASRLINYNSMEERAEKQLMEAELERASSIQKRLLDIKYPEVHGFEFYAFQQQCRAVGGDLYDLHILEDGRFLFLVADVSGKGMGAALLMSNILASLRILYQMENIQLPKLVAEVSKQLFIYSAPEDFATLFIGTIDPKTSILTYVNAGHNPPVITNKSGENVLLQASGVMVGAFDAMVWEESSIDFKESDILTIFSDGVTEAEKEDESQYGEERLEKLLIDNLAMAPKELSEFLIDDIDKFADGHPPSDDVTTLIIKKMV